MIEQHLDESSKAWQAYICYQNLGPQRTIALAYANYQGSATARPSAAFIRWKSEFKWDDRIKLWDASEEEKARERQRETDDEAYKIELEQFRQSQLSAGRMGVAIVLNLKKKLLDWVETHPTIESFSDALTAARIIMTLEISSSEQWAKALHIDLLLARMDEEEQFEN